MPSDLSWVDEEVRITRRILPEFTDSLWKKVSSGKSSEIDEIANIICKELNFHEGSIDRNKLFLSIARSVDAKDEEQFKTIAMGCKFNLKQVKNITGQLNLPCGKRVFPPCFEGQSYTASQLRSLEEYVQSPNTDFTGAVAVYQPNIEVGPASSSFASDAEHNDKYYNIASVAKIFTGILPLKLVHDGRIPEHKLTDIGITVPDEVITHFPEEHRVEVRQRLSEISLHQLMTHTAGFGDYGPGYFREMKEYTERDEQPPEYSDHNEQLRFSFDNENNGLTPIGEPRYSNVGMVLLAAATQELYNQNKHTNLTYNEILEQEIFNPADITVCKRAPDGMACFSAGDAITPHYLASPAGCAWMKPNDLIKFGQYVQAQLYKPNPKIQRLFKTYGREFFDTQTETIHHRGDLPGDPGANAEFYAAMRTGEVFTTLSDKPNEASNLYYFSLEQLGREAGFVPEPEAQHTDEDEPISRPDI